ncbi:MAG: ComEC/Rec2 family competence protein [Oscillospiraceae bacterium]
MNEENRAIFGLPLVRFAPFLAVGMLTAYYGGSLVSAIVIGCSAAVFLLTAILKKPFAVNMAGLLCGTLAMFGFMYLYVLPVTEFSGKTVNANFVVDEILTHSEDCQQIVARLSVGGIPTKATLDCDISLDEGQRAGAVITFSEYDAENATYNIADGTLLSGEAEIVSVGDISPAAALPNTLRSLRRLFAGRVRENIGGDTGELALSMLFGMDEQLPNYLFERLRICGAMHFTAVSGTHFTVFASLLLGMIPADNRKERALLSMIFAPMAVTFFGVTSSVIRASAMFTICSMSDLFFRKSETLNTLCAAVTAICLVSPASAIDIGFQMSVCGAYGAGVVGVKTADRVCGFLPKRRQRLAPLIRILLISAGAVICTAPLSAMLFKGVSVAGVLTSVVLMPLIMIAFLFALFLGITGFGLLSLPLAIVMKLVLLLANSLGTLRGLWLTTDHIGSWIALAIVAAAATVHAMGSLRRIEISAYCAAVMLLFTISGALYMENNRFTTIMVDNTQGSAVIVISGSEARVDIRRADGDFSRTLLRTLRENGAKTLCEVYVSDTSYSGTLTALDLIESFGAKPLFSRN